MANKITGAEYREFEDMVKYSRDSSFYAITNAMIKDVSGNIYFAVKFGVTINFKERYARHISNLMNYVHITNSRCNSGYMKKEKNDVLDKEANTPIRLLHHVHFNINCGRPRLVNSREINNDLALEKEDKFKERYSKYLFRNSKFAKIVHFPNSTEILIIPKGEYKRFVDEMNTSFNGGEEEIRALEERLNVLRKKRR